MKIRKVGLVLAVGLAVFSLAACGKSAKDTVVSSTETLLNAKQSETKLKVTASVDAANVKDLTDEEKAVLENVKNFSLTADSKTDKEAKKSEATIGVKFNTGVMDMNFSLPIFVDEGKNTYYFKAENIKSLLSLAGITSDDFDKFEGKAIELKGDELGTNTADAQKLNDITTKTLINYISSLPEEKFKEDGDDYSVTLNKKDLEGLVTKIATDLKSIKSAGITDAEIKELKDGFNKAFASDTNLVLTYTLDGKDIKKQNIVLNLHAVNSNDKKEDVKVALTFDSEIVSINKKVNFTFDTSEKNVVPMEELQEAITNFYMNQQTFIDKGISTVDEGLAQDGTVTAQ